MSFGGFGNSGFGANNNNSNNRTGSLFGGSGGGFGSNTNTSNTGFGASGNTGFGANNTTGGGLFGSNNNNTPSSGFGSGGFGSNNNTTGNSTSLFGGGNNNSSGGSIFGNNASTGSSGFGSGSTGFGATSNTNTTSGFGSNTSGGLFGNKSNTTSTGFGGSTTGNSGGSSLFGGGNTSTGFGSSNNNNSGTGFGGGTGFGSGASNAPGQNPGTGGTPFQSVVESDGVGSIAKVHYQTIAFQEPYKSWSFQELRQQDYDQGRRFGNSNGQAGAFGAAPTFGGASNNTSTGGFGSTGFGGGFGANNNNSNNTGTGFGASTNTGFGSNNSGGLFGNQSTKPATNSLFGNSTTSAPSGGGLFGSSNNNTGGGFGSSNTGSGAFGGTSNTGFGANTGGFGSNNTSSGGGLFGNQNATASSGSFGTGFGQQNQQNNQNTNTGFGGGFGAANNNQSKSLFGGNNSGNGSSLFGNNNQQNNQPANPSPFGGNNNNNSASGTLFGQQPKPATGGGLFGNNNTTNNSGGGLFGNNNSTQSAQPANNSLFGSKPNLFGGSTTNTNNNTGSLFGNNSTNNNQPSNGTSLFGNSNNSQPSGGNSLFGNTQPQQLQPSQVPQQLIASVNSANPYGHEQLFANLGTPQQAVGPLATPLSSSQKPRRPAPLPAYKLNPAASTRLVTPQKRAGYGFSYSTYGTPGSAYGSPSPYSGSLLGAGYGGRTLNKSVSTGSLRFPYSGEESILNPNAFSPNPRSARGSGSMKRLQINRNLRTDLFGSNDLADGVRASPLKKNVSFEDEASGDAHANGQTSNALVRIEDRDSATPTAEEMGYLRSSRSQTSEPSPMRETEQGNGKELATVPEHGSPDEPVASKEQDTLVAKAHRDHEDLEMGAYWMSPTEKQLKKMTRPGLASLKNLTVGRVGAGQIIFSQVDLTNVNISDILGGIVVLKLRSATVYPDHLTKPQEGKGLNVPAVVTLANSWPRSHGGRVKVFEKKGPKFEKHLDRMRRLQNTQFVDYNADTGEWTFRVEHFSSYGLDYDDDDSGMVSPMRDSNGPDSSPLHGRSATYGNSGGNDMSTLTEGSPHDADDTFEFKRGRNMPGVFEHGLNAVDIQDPMDYASQESGVNYDQSMTSESYSQLHSSGSRVREGNEPNGFLEPSDHSTGLDGQADTDSPRHSPPLIQSLKPKSILKVSQQPGSIFGTPSKGTHILDEDDWAGQLQRTLSPKKQNRQALRETQGAVLQAQKPAHTFTEIAQDDRPFTNSIDILKSLYGNGRGSAHGVGMKQTAAEKGFKWPYPKRNKTTLDSGEMTDSDSQFHSSLKPSWSLGSVLIPAPKSTQNARRRSQRMSQGSEIRAATPLPREEPSRSFAEFRKLTTIELVDQVPRAQLHWNFSFAAFATRAADADAAALNEEIMWQLAQILFDSQDPATDEQSKRKEILTQFWKSITTSQALEHAKSAKTAEEKAFAQLSSFDVWSATETLLKGGDSRLATMIAQIGANESTQKAIAEQINHWRDENDISEIPPDIRTLYELLAGNTCVAKGKSGSGPENKAETFNISWKFGLDWRRAFGLKLWYGIGKEESIAEAVELYKDDLSSYEEKTRPVPWFVAAKAHTGWTDPRAGDRQDVLWGLLKLYAHHQALQFQDATTDNEIDVAAFLAPESISGNPLSTCLSFQLYHALLARSLLPRTDTSSEEPGNTHFADTLAETLASQFSATPHTLDLAVFTMMFLSSATARSSSIKAVLTHHAGALGQSPELCPNFRALTSALKIPAAWIYNAKAVFERSVTGDRAAQALNLLRAGETREAHEVLVRAVAPLCVIEERVIGSSPDNLKQVLKEFKESDAVHLPNWKRGGGLYSDFVDVVEFAPGAAESEESGSDARIRPGSQQELRRLCKRVRATLPARVSEGWKNMGLEERAACEEMRDVVGRAEVALEKARGGEGSGGFGEDGNAIKGREDEALKSAREASEAFYSRFAVEV